MTRRTRTLALALLLAVPAAVVALEQREARSYAAWQVEQRARLEGELRDYDIERCYTGKLDPTSARCKELEDYWRSPQGD